MKLGTTKTWIAASLVLSQFFCAVAQSKDLNSIEAADTTNSAEASQRMSDFIEFAEEVDARNPHRSLYSSDEWGNDERDIVLELMQEIFDSSPGLIISSGYSKKLLLIRRRGFPRHTASAGFGRISFSDYFFDHRRISERRGWLTHELVHAGDVGCLIAYSRSWSQFAQPRILKTRIALTFLEPNERTKYVRDIRARNFWPSAYASTNLIEGLAEFCSSGLTNELELGHEFRKLATSLLEPSKEHLIWKGSVREGMRRFLQKDFQKALDIFLKARATRDTPELTLCIARSHLSLDQTANSLKELLECKRQFDSLDIDCLDPRKSEAVLQAAIIQFDNGEFAKAIELLDELLSVNTSATNRSALALRSRCNLKLGQLSRALQDEMESKGYSFYREYPIANRGIKCAVALPLVEKASLLAGQNSDWSMAKALLYEKMADQETDRNEANSWLLKALDEYRTDSPNDKTEFARHLADIDIRLGKFDEAESILKTILQKEPEDLIAQVEIVKLYERRNKRTKAKEEFDRLTKAIGSLKTVELWRNEAKNPLAVLTCAQVDELLKELR